MSYGVLRSAANTGSDDELLCKFAAPMKIESNSPTFSNDTLSLRRVRSRQSAQRWEIETEIAQDVGLTEFFINMVVSGNSETIFLRMPQLYARGKILKTAIVKTTGTAAAGASSISVSGANLPIGEFVTFTGDPKVYTVVSHVGTTLTVFPDFKKAKTANLTVTHSDNVVMRAVYDTSVISGMRYSDGILSEIGTVRFIEDV